MSSLNGMLFVSTDEACTILTAWVSLHSLLMLLIVAWWKLISFFFFFSFFSFFFLCVCVYVHVYHGILF